MATARAESQARRWALRIAIGYGAALCLVWFGVSRWAAIAPAPDDRAAWPAPASSRLLDERSASNVFASLRRAIFEGAEAPLAVGRWRGRAALWCRGHQIACSSVISDGARISAPDLARSEEARGLDAEQRAACRLRLDVDRGRGPIVASIEPLFALSVIAGADGVGVDLAGREIVLGPDELLASDLLAGHRPFAAIDMDLGLDVRGVLRHLALAARVSGDQWRRTPHHLFRVRYESWVEPGAGERPSERAVPLLRGHLLAPPLSPEALRDAGLAGARYLERHLRPEGRFDYIYDALADQALPDVTDYSFPRHAGAAWYLAQSAAALSDPRFAAAARRALEYLAEHPPAGCDRPAWACVGNPGDRTVDLGSTAMALLAATEYRRATGDARFDAWARRLGAFVVMMQRPDGDFRHLYDLAADAPDEKARLLYFSGEASFALSRLAADAGTSPADRADLAARVDRALDWLTGPNYGYFAGSFFFGEDHWTCIAVDDAWDVVGERSGRERYGDFCERFAEFMARSRFREGDDPVRDQPDLAGASGFTPMMPPHPTPVGSRAEALISTYRIATRRGHAAAADRIAAGVRDSMRFLLARQIRADGAWMMPDPAAADGGFTMSDVTRQIRVDFIQHAGSSMLRAATVPALCTEAARPSGN